MKLQQLLTNLLNEGTEKFTEIQEGWFNLARDLTGHLDVETKEMSDKRLALCAICPARAKFFCGLCLCPVIGKSYSPTSKCPLGKF